MSADTVLWLYLTVFFLYVIFDVLLSVLNIHHVQAHSGRVPEFFAAYVDDQIYQRSAAYTLAKNKFAVFSSSYSAAIILTFVLGGLFGRLERFVGVFNLDPYWSGIGYVFLVSFIFSLLHLPLELYSIFVLEERFGFNRTTFKLWFCDLLKSIVLSLLLGLPLLCALFWFIEAAGPFWWVYSFVLTAIFELFVAMLYPTWIAPLFNKFTPLPDGALKEAVRALIERVGFEASGLFVMDASKRSTHGNAYFTGFGRSKRVVLFDTLLRSLTNEQVVAVLAHEIGHQKKHHLKKSILLSLVVTLIGFYVLSILMRSAPAFQAFGFAGPSLGGALILLSFLSAPFVFFLSPLLSALSRRFEYEADRFVLQSGVGVDNLIQGLMALSKESLANLVPHPWYSFFHYSHPTLAERIRELKKCAQAS